MYHSTTWNNLFLLILCIPALCHRIEHSFTWKKNATSCIPFNNIYVMWSSKMSWNSQILTLWYSHTKRIISLLPIAFTTLQLLVSLEPIWMWFAVKGSFASDVLQSIKEHWIWPIPDSFCCSFLLHPSLEEWGWPRAKVSPSPFVHWVSLKLKLFLEKRYHYCYSYQDEPAKIKLTVWILVQISRHGSGSHGDFWMSFQIVLHGNL